MSTALPRSKVKKNQMWNAESVFESPEAFDAEAKSILESLPGIKEFQGHLGDSPDTFIEAMNAIEGLARRAARVQVYATMSSSVDATDKQGAEISGKQRVRSPRSAPRPHLSIPSCSASVRRNCTSGCQMTRA